MQRDLDSILALARELTDLHKTLDPLFTRSADCDAVFRRFALRNIRRTVAYVLVAVFDVQRARRKVLAEDGIHALSSNAVPRPAVDMSVVQT